MIPGSDLFLFNTALLGLYAPGLDIGNYPGRGFEFLARIVSIELVVHGAHTIENGRRQAAFCLDRELPEMADAALAFHNLAMKYPMFHANPSINGGKPYCRSDFFSDRQYLSLDIHSEVFRRWGHENFSTMCVHVTPGQILVFACSRGKGGFTDKERTMLELAQPHLGMAYQMAVSLSQLKPGRLSPELFSNHGFTPRESEVLYWLTEGKSNVEIAVIMRIGLPTVKGYLTAIFNKTGTGNRLAATLHALELARKIRAQTAFHANTSRLPYHYQYDASPTKVG